MVTPNRKYLMQNPKDPARWEALEILASDPSQHFRTELDTEGAIRRRDEGGFMIVPSRQYNSALADVSDAVRRKREVPPPPSGSSAKAEDIAREAEAEGRSVGPAMMAELGDERASLAGYRVQPRAFRKPSPEMLAQAEAEQEGFQQGLRLRGEPPARGGTQSQPRVAANGVGDMPAFRPPAALRPPSDRSEPMSEAEGVAVRTATPTRDEEFAAAQDEANRRALMSGLGRAGARLNEAFTGVGGDTAFYDQLARESDSPVRQLLAQREADKRRALEDPSSEQSQRIQAWVSKALPGVYTQEEISQMTAGDADMVTRYGEMRQRLDQRAADRAAMAEQRAADIAREDAQRLDDRQWQSRQAAAGRAFTASENAKNRAANIAEAQARADGTATKGTTIPGLEVAPGAAPTADDAKRVKGAVAAKERLQALTGELRGLHQKYGTELAGANAQRMSQLTTAIQLEAKTLAELGALTGPDLELVQRITGEDPSSLKANLKSLVGLDNTQETLAGVDQWGSSLADATKKTYGYRDAPQATPATQRSVVDRIKMPDGKTVTLYSDGTEEVSG